VPILRESTPPGQAADALPLPDPADFCRPVTRAELAARFPADYCASLRAAGWLWDGRLCVVDAECLVVEPADPLAVGRAVADLLLEGAR
jgi:hypothetical protein